MREGGKREGGRKWRVKDKKEKRTASSKLVLAISIAY